MTCPRETLEKIRDHSVGTTEDGPCIEREHMIEIAKAAIPVAELHEQAAKLWERYFPCMSNEEMKDIEDSAKSILTQLKAQAGKMSSNNIFVVERDKSKGTPIATEMPCGHVHWGNAPKNCPVCAQINAAEKKRGAEVLELVKEVIRDNATVSYSEDDGDIYKRNHISIVITTLEDKFDQTYQERFPEQV
ncbi:unnamed protein product [marine sediment metagenome]|uniref:Uncharacterized protein n=1 Tax=marine sediment metagenome TaxID=412755 RepID=X1CND7_9ZZZZ